VILASEFVYSGDTADVHQTIINGSHLTQGDSLGSVIRIVSNETLDAEVIGFTITGGKGVYAPSTYGSSGRRGGGLFVMYASATISHNVITDNQCFSRFCFGGGIGLQFGNAVITSNIITENRLSGVNTHRGGGIATDEVGTLLISDNVIQDNLRGGVYLQSVEDGIVERNLIADNQENGIELHGRLMIRDNDILRNGGSGIYANYTWPSIIGNVIAGNSRGIESRASHMEIVNNTIVNNCGVSTGGGIYKSWHNVTTLNLTNNILWGNGGAGYGSQISLDEGVILNASYNDIQGGQNDIQLGTEITVNWLDGNIDADPQFASPDFSLLSNSPCINAGHPDEEYNDPDGSRNDMGAIPFVVLSTNVQPDTLYAWQSNSITPDSLSIYLGNLGNGMSVTDIDPTSLVVNDSIAPTSWFVLDAFPGYTSEVLVMYVPLRAFILSYGVVWDESYRSYRIDGQYTDTTEFTYYGTFTLIGHISGDLNNDGQVDVSDLVCLVDYCFRGGPLPLLLESADLDHNGTVDIADLVELVEYLFIGGP
jgi:parallel beta-helix repeat protein